MRRSSVCLVLLVGVLSSALVVAPVKAQQSVATDIGNKFARGVTNTAFGLVADWPKTIYYESSDHGAAWGSTGGVGKGLVNGIARTGVGIYDTVTFPIPFPQNFESAVQPGYVFESGKTNFGTSSSRSQRRASKRFASDPDVTLFKATF